MDDYIKDGLKPTHNMDGKEIDVEVKSGKVETTLIRTETDENGKIIKQTRFDKQHKKRTSRKGWGRMYEMDFMSAIELMVENSKTTYKVFRYLLNNAGRDNYVKAENSKQVNIAKDLSFSKSTISPIMKFFENQEFVCRVGAGLMINPYLCAKNGVSDDELYRIQMIWEDEIGFYGKDRVKDTINEEIKDIKRSKAKSFSRLHK